MTQVLVELDDSDDDADAAASARSKLLKAKEDFFVVQDSEAFLVENNQLSNYVELDMENIVEEAINVTRDKEGPFM